MEPLKVLQVNKWYAPHIGGVEKVVQHISEAMMEKISIRVLVCQEKGRRSEELYNHVPVYRAWSLGTLWSMPISLEFPMKLVEMVNDADVVHFHLPFPLGDFAYILADWSRVIRRKKVVVTWHSDIIRQKKIMKIYWPFLRRFLERADAIIVTSPNMLIHSPYLKPFVHKCRVIPLGIDPPLSYPGQELIKKMGIRLKYDQTVLFVGRLCYYKGVQYLVDAIEHVDANLIIAGDGELRESLEEKSKRKGLEHKIHFVGRCSEEELAGLYDHSNMLVLPSVEASEAFGLVQLEAMSRGKPVVNTALPTGVPYVSRHGETGLTVSPRSSSALQKAIQYILDTPKEAARFGANGMKRVQQYFTKQKMVEQYRQLYLELSSSGQPLIGES